MLVLNALLERSNLPADAGLVLRRWCRSWLGAGAALAVLCALVYGVGLKAIPPVDRDESRFAQASRQMLESGDYVLPQVQDRPRLNKPPGIYWLQAASAGVLGDSQADITHQNIWAYRLPSAIAALVAVLLTWRIGVRLLDPRAAVLGAALLATCPIMVWEAHQARADQLLLATVTVSVLALTHIWRKAACGQRASAWWALLLWLGVGAGIMAKGPITPMVIVLTAIGVSLATRRWAWLKQTRAWMALIILPAVVGPWVYFVAQRVGFENYLRIIFEETIGRSGDAAEGHWGPPGYHVIALVVMLFPGSLLTAAAVVRAWKMGGGSWREARLGASKAWRARPETFLLAWIVPSWIVFELVATKLPHYTMPLYPAIALLSARAALSGPKLMKQLGKASGAGFSLWLGVGAIGLAGTLMGLAWWGGMREQSGLVMTVAVGGGGAAVILGLLVVARVGLARGRVIRAHVLGMGAMVVWSGAMLGVVLPRSERVWINSRVATAVMELSAEMVRPVALVSYHEDSQIFLLRGRGERIDAEYLPLWVKKHPTGLVVVDKLREPGAAAYAEGVLEYGAEVRGYNYSVGRRVELMVYRPRADGRPQ